MPYYSTFRTAAMKIIECPRDAMQGIDRFIPTDTKIAYLRQLMRVGFDTLDAGSFVSPKAIPQMRDTAEVIQALDEPTATKVLVIVANRRGAEDACRFPRIDLLGFPLSLSETFQQRNTNQSIATALNTLNEIQELCVGHNKTLVAYLSMGFGNPYGDPYSPETVWKFIDILQAMDIRIVSLADTIGVSTPDQISVLFRQVLPSFPGLEIGAHLHSQPAKSLQRIKAAVASGCRRIDGALRGFGGCPMAEDDLVGNLATETILSYLDANGIQTSINREELKKAMAMADAVFTAAP